jgi:2-polyprenyl-3-methyl-5-hydroxy-6-metoxy-1,4-benzoquinol methylase
MDEPFRELDAEALALFARKGWQGGPGVPQAGEANAVKVRRVLQITRDLARRPLQGLRILDLGCGEGVYAIEAAIHGAEVLALDARTERMDEGAICAARHALANVRFVREDVRHVTRQAYGKFDVVYLLGLLYHLDTTDVFSVLENIHAMCDGLLVVDTLVSPAPEVVATWGGHTYGGQRCREHADEDSEEVRRSRVLKSMGNTFSFRFTRESLLRVLHDVGFTSAFECHVPFEPHKPEDRLTVAAVKGAPVVLSTYPWINGQAEAEIERRLRPAGDPPP